MSDFYSKFYPKPRTGKECKKVECERHADYLEWEWSNSSLEFCMACKNAHVSQYKKKEKDDE
ncbi:MAG: hypothetical protein R8M45_05060 [Ghiorsea sp.]